MIGPRPDPSPPARSRPATRCPLLAAALWALLTACPAAGDAPPWEKAFFQAPPDKLREAARQLPTVDGASVQILLHEMVYRVDDRNRVEQTARWVYRILDRAGVEGWSDLETDWSPWYQERPRVRARISNPDGKVHLLQAKDILETSPGDDEEKTYSDDRVLSAPLPGVTVGSVVEEEIVGRDHQPYTPEGAFEGIQVAPGYVYGRLRIVVDVPEGFPFVFQARLLPPVKEKRETAGGRVRRTWEWDNLEPHGETETGLPPDISRKPSFSFSTCPSWKRVASAYDALTRDLLDSEAFSVIRKEVGELDPAVPEKAVRRVVAWVHGKVRYTGLELGERSIVPAGPAEVLRRGFGDCKDKSVLAAGILRRAGIPARLALLRGGPGEDVDPSLPGLANFDHVILVVPGAKPVWADPTDAIPRGGALPRSDQGRWALVVGPETEALERTPQARSADNGILETRDVVLADSGAGSVEETSTFFGDAEEVARESWEDVTDSGMAAALADYLASEYRGGVFVEGRVTGAADPAEALRVRFRLNRFGRSITEDDTASLAILPGSALSWLPDELTAATPGPRRNRYLVSTPHVFHLEYRILPPAGFAPRTIPGDETLTLGTMSLERRFEPLENGGLRAVLRFDSGKAELTAAEFDQTRAALRKWLDTKPLVLHFDHLGKKALLDGNSVAAVAAYHRMAEKEPGKAIHRQRLARALLRVGFGDAAREAALEATRLDPASAAAFSTYAWTLQHDVLARRFAEGWDRDGAVRAYEKAIALPSDDTGKDIFDLAFVLEHDARGWRYAVPTPDLERAANCYRRLPADRLDDAARGNLALVLAHLGCFPEIRELAGAVEDPEVRDRLHLLAVAAEEGPEAAVREAAGIHPEENRRSALDFAAGVLLQLRIYPAAARLAREAARGADDFLTREANADQIARLVRTEFPKDAPRTPSDTARRYLAALPSPAGADDALLQPLLSPDFLDDLTDPDALDREAPRWADTVLAGLRVPREVYIDFFLSFPDIRVDGNDASGYIVEIGPGGGFPSTAYCYVVRQGGRLCVLGDSDHESGIGFHVLTLLEAKRFEEARFWLDHYGRRHPGNPFPVQPLDQVPFHVFWDGNHPDDLFRMRMAAVLMVRDGKRLREAAGILEKGRSDCTDELQRGAVDAALAALYSKIPDYPAMLGVSDRLVRNHPDAEFAVLARVTALRLANRAMEAEALLGEAARRNPSAKFHRRLRFSVLAAQERFDEAVSAFDALLAAGEVDAGALNTRAWMACFQGRVTERDLELARRAVSVSNAPGAADALHTLATLYAETGRGEEAMKVLCQVITARRRTRPTPPDWYVIGRLAEHYGLGPAARNAYARALESPAGEGRSLPCAELARRRLKNLTEGAADR